MSPPLARLAPLGAISLMVALAACSTTSASEPDASHHQAFTTLVERNIAYALDAGAAQQQVDVLTQAQALGVMSTEAALEAARSFASCSESVGTLVDIAPAEGAVDFPVISYWIRSSDTSGADACYEAHFRYVDDVYQLQPATQEARRAILMQHADALEACVRDQGIDLPHAPSADELRAALFALLVGYNPEHPDTTLPGVDCFTPVGLDPNNM